MDLPPAWISYKSLIPVNIILSIAISICCNMRYDILNCGIVMRSHSVADFSQMLQYGFLLL